MGRHKSFDSTGQAPAGILYHTDLNAIQDLYAELDDFTQNIHADSIDIGETGLTLSRHSSGVLEISGELRVTDLTVVNGILNAIANGSVTAAKLASGSVTTPKIATDAVTAAKIDNGAVTGTKIADDAITDTKIASGAVTSDKLSAGAVINTKIIDDAVTTAKIADDAITSDKIEDDAVLSASIDDGAVETNDLADDAVVSDKIGSSAVTTTKIATNAVTASKIASGAVTEIKINSDAVTESKIANSAVTTDKIENDAVIASKIANSAVTRSKLANDSIGTSELADAAITAAKIADGAIVPGVTTSATAPPNPSDNDLWFDTTEKKLKYYGTLQRIYALNNTEGNVNAFMVDGSQIPRETLAIGSTNYTGLGVTESRFYIMHAGGDVLVFDRGYNRISSEEFSVASTGGSSKTYNGITINSTGIFIVESSTLDRLHIFSLQGVFQSSVNLSDNFYSGIASSDTRVYVLRTTRQIQVFDVSGNPQSTEDITLGGINSAVDGLTLFEGKFWATSNLDDQIYVWLTNGTRSATDDISLGSGSWTGVAGLSIANSFIEV